MKKNKAPRVANAHENGRAASVVALAAGSLWVPAAEILLLASIFRTVGETGQRVAMECGSRGARVKAARNRGSGGAYLLVAYKLRRLVEEASVRQPTENPKDEPDGQST